MDKRTFLKRLFSFSLGVFSSYASLSLTGCAGFFFDPHEDYIKNPDKFDLDEFEAWFCRGWRDPELSKKGVHRLYNSHNPYHNQIMHTFKESNTKWPGLGVSPGHGYSLDVGEDMIAMMPGRVIAIGKYISPRSSGGWDDQYAQIQSPDKGPKCVSIEYGHLSNVKVREGQLVERGDKIGSGSTYASQLKIMIYEGDYLAANLHEDPDNYGIRHEYMGFLPDLNNDTLSKYPVSTIVKKKKTQRDIMLDLTEKVDVPNARRRFRRNHVHFKGSKKAPPWSTLEEYRFLETLYTINPTIFPTISPIQFAKIREDFYDNQPFLLTLPIEKA